VLGELLSGEKPAVDHKVVSILGVDILQTAREYGVAVLVALGRPDMEQAAVEVKVADFEADNFTYAKAAGVGEGEEKPVFYIRKSA